MVSVPDCKTCDHAYRSSFVDMIRSARPGTASMYDIDMVLEVDSRIVAIFEYKRYQKRYPDYMIPAFEYIALMKFARLLRVVPYIIVEIVEGGQSFHVFKVDRFAPKRELITWKTGRKFAVFPASESEEMDADDLREFITHLAQGGA